MFVFLNLSDSEWLGSIYQLDTHERFGGFWYCDEVQRWCVRPSNQHSGSHINRLVRYNMVRIRRLSFTQYLME